MTELNLKNGRLSLLSPTDSAKDRLTGYFCGMQNAQYKIIMKKQPPSKRRRRKGDEIRNTELNYYKPKQAEGLYGKVS